MRKPIRDTFRLLTAVFLALWASSCEESNLPLRNNVPEGEEASVTFSYGFAEPVRLSRGTKLDEEAESKVNSLWIGIYNVNTGECTYNNVFESGSADAQFWGSGDVLDNTNKQVTLKSVKSGESYIVAVANVFTNYGVMEGYRLDLTEGNYKTNIYEDGTDLTKMRRLPLAYLLKKADTWEKFQAISTVQLDARQVQRSTSDFPMTGFYCQGTSHPDTWYDNKGNPSQTAMIYPGSNKLNGLVHLRRQRSYNKFKILAADNVTVTPISWQVMNIPAYSSLLESGNNAGDYAVGITGRTDLYPSGNYGPGNKNDGFDNETEWKAGDGKACHSFDFYIFGNRRTAKEWVARYDDREMEYKVAGENVNWTDPAGIKLPVFKSLVAESPDDAISSEDDYQTMDLKPNNATYVILTATVDYWAKPEYDTNGNITKYTPIPESEATEANPPAGVVRRHGTGVYTIHLGYCDGADEAAKARDFNCLRNTDYTYYVTVDGLDNIRVEAVRAGEPQPGAEGDVSDTDQSLIQLDSHYCTFNIELTNRDRLNISYYMEIPYADQVFYYNSLEHGLTNNPAETGVPDMCVNWIEFRPSYSSDKLAVYNIEGDSNYGAPWTFEDLHDVKGHLAVTDENGTTVTNVPDIPDNWENDTKWINEHQDWLNESHYYTVFVNEYTYAGQSWHVFSNKPDRRVWLMNENDRLSSADGESSYIKSKYLIQQSSIDTYYSDVDYQTSFVCPATIYNGTNYAAFTVSGTNISTNAVGVETINESLGLNICWTVGDGPGSATNGRWNVWSLLGGSSGGAQAEKTWRDIAQYSANGRWQNALSFATKVTWNGATIAEQGDKRTFSLNPVSNPPTNISTVPNPDDKNLYEMVYQCLSRNRDENGNGKIDAQELRWFLPTTRTYMRMIIGESSITTPFADYEKYGAAALQESTKQRRGPFHYITSNKQMLWMEQGMAFGTKNMGIFTNHGIHNCAWNLRCIRLLGTSLAEITENVEAEYAYRFFDQNGREGIVDNKPNAEADFTIGGYFLMWRYDQVNNATPVTEAIPLHRVDNDVNKTSFAFEFRGEPTGDSDKVTFDGSGYSSDKEWIKSNPCSKFNVNGETGWRVPTIQELSLMVLAQNNYDHSLGFKNAYCYASCSYDYLEENVLYASWGNGLGITNEPSGSKYIRCVRDVIPE